MIEQGLTNEEEEEFEMVRSNQYLRSRSRSRLSGIVEEGNADTSLCLARLTPGTRHTSSKKDFDTSPPNTLA